MIRKFIITAFLAMSGNNVQAEDSETSRLEEQYIKASSVEAGIGYDSLDNNFDDWMSHYVSINEKVNENNAIYAVVRHTERFDIDDVEYTAGWYHDLNEHWLLHTEFSWSPSPVVRPDNRQQVLLYRKLPDAWVVGGGFKHVNWPNSTSNALIGSVEKYWSNYRWALVTTFDHVVGGENANSYAFILSGYYDHYSNWNIAFATGDELEKIADNRILRTKVDSISIYGLHQISTDWAIRWALVASEQGDIYSKRGIELGIRYQF